jgi:hypothetical protein
MNLRLPQAAAAEAAALFPAAEQQTHGEGSVSLRNPAIGSHTKEHNAIN